MIIACNRMSLPVASSCAGAFALAILQVLWMPLGNLNAFFGASPVREGGGERIVAGRPLESAEEKRVMFNTSLRSSHSVPSVSEVLRLDVGLMACDSPTFTEEMGAQVNIAGTKQATTADSTPETSELQKSLDGATLRVKVPRVAGVENIPLLVSLENQSDGIVEIMEARKRPMCCVRICREDKTEVPYTLVGEGMFVSPGAGSYFFSRIAPGSQREWRINISNAFEGLVPGKYFLTFATRAIFVDTSDASMPRTSEISVQELPFQIK